MFLIELTDEQRKVLDNALGEILDGLAYTPDSDDKPVLKSIQDLF